MPRAALCVFLAAMLLTVFICSAPVPAPPPGRQAAWWALLCPGLFGLYEAEEHVEFAFPLLKWLGRDILRLG